MFAKCIYSWTRSFFLHKTLKCNKRSLVENSKLVLYVLMSLILCELRANFRFNRNFFLFTCKITNIIIYDSIICTKFNSYSCHINFNKLLKASTISLKKKKKPVSLWVFFFFYCCLLLFKEEIAFSNLFQFFCATHSLTMHF